jgi:hypothetical protein
VGQVANLSHLAATGLTYLPWSLLMSRLLFALLLMAMGVPLLPAQPGDKIVLFNGKDLDGWVVEGAGEHKDKDQVKKVWNVRDGLLVCEGKGYGFLRYGKKEFSDFLFHLEYRMAKKCNSGIGIRTVPFDPKNSMATRPSYACYEIQLLDDAGKPPTKHSTGSLYRYVAPASNPVKPAGEWNTLEIQCVGPHIQLTLNDQKIIDVDQSTIDEIKKNPLKGYVCLQNHGGTIEFRNLYVRELPSK